MAYRRVKIVNCKTASIRRTPWIPLHDKEIVGIRDGPILEDDTIVKSGETVEVDPDVYCYDWTDRKFYRVRTPKGWIYEGVIDLEDDTGG